MEKRINKEQVDRVTLLLEIEEKKYQYKKEYRPIFWYWILLLIAIGITAGMITVAAIFGDFFLGLLSVISILACIFAISYFFPHYTFKGISRIKSLLSIKEEIESLQIQLQLFDDFVAQQRSPQQKYKDELSRNILQYKRQANSYRRTHYLLQIVVILFSLFVTALTSGLAVLIGFADKQWITAAVSFAVSFLTAMMTLFRFHDRGYHLQQTADAIEYELKNAELHIYDYSPPLSDEEVLRKLAERGTRLIDEQRKRQLQLEQASNTKPDEK